MPARFKQIRSEEIRRGSVIFQIESNNWDDEHKLWQESFLWCEEQFGKPNGEDEIWIVKWPIFVFINPDHGFAFKMRWL